MCFVYASIPILLAAFLAPTSVSIADRGYALLIVGVLWFAAHSHRERGGSIDVSIDNKVIGYDDNGRYLVKAKSIRNITGPHSGALHNLPAHITGISKGLYVVDRGNGYRDNSDATAGDFMPVDGNFHVQPRGAGNGLTDMMAGWTHNYIQEDK